MNTCALGDLCTTTSIRASSYPARTFNDPHATSLVVAVLLLQWSPIVCIPRTIVHAPGVESHEDHHVFGHANRPDRPVRAECLRTEWWRHTKLQGYGCD